MDSLEFGRRAVGDCIALVMPDLIRQPQFLKQPEYPLRTAIVEMVNDDRRGATSKDLSDWLTHARTCKAKARTFLERTVRAFLIWRTAATIKAQLVAFKDQASSSASGPAINPSATFSVRPRIAASMRLQISGFSRRKFFEFSRPCPIRMES